MEPTQAVRALGGVPGLVKADLDPLLRRLDTDGDGRVSLPDLMEWGERSFLSAAGVENSVSIHRRSLARPSYRQALPQQNIKPLREALLT